MSRQELAEAINAYLWLEHERTASLDENYIGKLERGDHRWPQGFYREAFRAILHARTDAELGFHIRRGTRFNHEVAAGINAGGRHERRGVEPVHRGLDLANHAYLDDLGTEGRFQDDDGLDALELGRRAGASDVNGALPRLEAAVDELAIAYAATPPEQLLPRVRRYLHYIGNLLDKRMTLDEHRRLLAAGGWLSLIAATLRIDLRHRWAGEANLTTAEELAQHAGHREIEAWCWETRAWDVLTAGNFARAVELSQRAQAVAPKGSSALIQATAQEGRAC